MSVSVIKGDLANTQNNAYKIPYAIQNTADTEVSNVSLFNVNDKTNLNICIATADWNAAKAGSYSATVSFSISMSSAA